jgi:FixJ family two-component response regulator
MTVKAMKAGAIEFLTKPLREQDVLDAVQLALDRDRARMEQEKKERELRRNFEMLTRREKGVLALVAAGLMNKQIAAEMGISEAGVKVHRRTIMTKLAATSVADLVRIAEALGVHRPIS